MKTKRIYSSVLKLSFALILSCICFCLQSCEKEDPNSEILNGTIWIYDFPEDIHLLDGDRATALYFGKEEVELFALDKNHSIVRRIDVYSYNIKGRTLTIGGKTYSLHPYSFYFHRNLYIKERK